MRPAFERTPSRLEAGELAAWLDGVGSPRRRSCPTVTGRPPHTALDGGRRRRARPRPRVGADRRARRGRPRGARDAVLADPTRDKVTHDAKLLDHAVRGRGWVVSDVTVDTELGRVPAQPRTAQLRPRTPRAPAPAAHHHARGRRRRGRPARRSTSHPTTAGRSGRIRAEATLELATFLGGELDERGQRDLHDRIELPLAPVLARMERTGVALDLHVLDEIRVAPGPPGHRTRTRGPRPRRSPVQRRLRPAAADGAVRRARAAEDPAHQDRLHDRRQRAAEPARPAPDHRSDHRSGAS